MSGALAEENSQLHIIIDNLTTTIRIHSHLFKPDFKYDAKDEETDEDKDEDNDEDKDDAPYDGGGSGGGSGGASGGASGGGSGGGADNDVGVREYRDGWGDGHASIVTDNGDSNQVKELEARLKKIHEQLKLSEDLKNSSSNLN